MTGDPFWRAITARGLHVPPAVAALHRATGVTRYRGRCDISRGRGPLARLALWLAGFPPAGTDVPLRLTLTSGPDGAEWVRDFAGHVTRSRLTYHAPSGQVIERFGPIRLALSLDVRDGGLFMSIASLRIAGIPLPRGLTPISTTRESEDGEGRFHFDVSARAPLIGFLIRYQGTLRPE